METSFKTRIVDNAGINLILEHVVTINNEEFIIPHCARSCMHTEDSILLAGQKELAGKVFKYLATAPRTDDVDTFYTKGRISFNIKTMRDYSLTLPNYIGKGIRQEYADSDKVVLIIKNYNQQASANIICREEEATRVLEELKEFVGSVPALRRNADKTACSLEVQLNMVLCES